MGVTPGKRDVNVSKYKKMQAGDLVVFTREGKVFASARVVYLLRNAEVARRIWGENRDGETWEYMYAMTPPVHHDLDYADLRGALGSRPGDNFMGFRVIDDVKAHQVYDLVGEESPVDEWRITPGQVLKRTVLHDQCGGARFGGIEPSTRTPNVFLFTSKAGETFGYNYDGFQEDGSFHYTGDGQVGDQSPDVGGGQSCPDRERIEGTASQAL